MAGSPTQMAKYRWLELDDGLVLQHETNVFVDNLRRADGDMFAGATLERTPSFHAEYYFVSIDLPEVQAALPKLGASAELLPLFQLEPARETEQRHAKAQGMQQATA